MQLPVKLIKLSLLGAFAFLLTFFAILTFFGTSQGQERQTKQIVSSEKVKIFDVSVVIENGGFSQNKIELAENSLSRIVIFNKDLNKTHQLVLILPYADGRNSLVERRSVKAGSKEKFLILNKPGKSEEPRDNNPLDIFIISCLSCASNTTLTLTSAK
ncbi:MAG: hypothetical protein N3F05_04125 [Candidatus Diapherotrites archaeon]|nr:hypothetical protein [Candidatus Diapherotrites archaeon]